MRNFKEQHSALNIIEPVHNFESNELILCYPRSMLIISVDYKDIKNVKIQKTL
jgi:hypothetical protein